MTDTFAIAIDAWSDGAPIPARFAFCRQADEGHVAMSDNVNPAIRWSGAPEGIESFAIICADPDVPSAGDDVNVEGRTVPADLPRVPFYHWTLVDIPSDTTEITEGAVCNGVTPRGKATGQTDDGVAGMNDYTGWFAGDADMAGTYGGYDGPCPPWNDSIMHHYHFEIFALDVSSLGLDGDFGGADARAAIEGHVLASASHMGTYSLNPDVTA